MDIKKLLEKLKTKSVIQKKLVNNVLFKECGYIKGSKLPIVGDDWKEFSLDSKWGEFRDTHSWFYFKTASAQGLYLITSPG